MNSAKKWIAEEEKLWDQCKQAEENWKSKYQKKRDADPEEKSKKIQIEFWAPEESFDESFEGKELFDLFVLFVEKLILSKNEDLRK